MAVRYRGQRVSTRKERRSSGISNESTGWEEKFNLSRESVEAAFEEGDDDEREGSGGSVEQGDGEKENYTEEEEEKVNQREEEDLEWRRENSLGDCEARLSEMLELMQKLMIKLKPTPIPMAIHNTDTKTAQQFID